LYLGITGIGYRYAGLDFYRDLWINGLELAIDGSGSGNATSEPNHYEHGAPADGVVYITVHGS
jgi:hypothetical protein